MNPPIPEIKRCFICGAKILRKRKSNSPNATTCSPECTRARDLGISREELLTREEQSLGWGENTH